MVTAHGPLGGAPAVLNELPVRISVKSLQLVLDTRVKLVLSSCQSNFFLCAVRSVSLWFSLSPVVLPFFSSRDTACYVSFLVLKTKGFRSRGDGAGNFGPRTLFRCDGGHCATGAP